MDNINPVFLISLPRSGSTLLQKILTVSPHISSVAEPWILLPLASMLERDVIVAEYGQLTCSYALEDLIKTMPKGRDDFNALIADYVRNTYRTVSDNQDAKYFLDKTPRYYHIIPFLASVFPDAKFIFLLRNPLDVLSSILKTWHKNRIDINLIGNYTDIMHGPRLISEGLHLVGDKSLVVNYAKLVDSPEEVAKDICQYLEIAYTDEMITEYKRVKLAGRMGDQVGVHAYDSVSTESAGNWKQNFGTPFRKWFASRYVNSLGSTVLNDFNLQIDNLHNEITDLKVSPWLGWRDLIGYIILKLALFLNQICSGSSTVWLKRLKNNPLMPHT